uniref:Neur_chan_LBD domain-containing protein n=1 Tax=Panagrellus redivivus TaxID=6233 RepID=A0A7E4V9H0_PANRE
MKVRYVVGLVACWAITLSGALSRSSVPPNSNLAASLKSHSNIPKEASENEKLGRMRELSSTSISWGTRALQEELPPVGAIEDMQERQKALVGRMPLRNVSNPTMHNKTGPSTDEFDYVDLNEFDQMSPHRRLVQDILDPEYYEKTVHPRRNFRHPTRVNLSMSLYQILEVNERLQSIAVNVWMVQDWYDEFADWNPTEYGMINTTIMPYDEIFIPDTYLYNSESLEQKRTEAIMNVILTSGYWRNDSRGAAVTLMFPAIYTLSCKLNVKHFPYDQQNCSFIISSWTRDKGTLDYHPKVENVNLKNFAKNEEWEVVSFDFVRREEHYKCCPEPWVMLYAHLVIKRKPLYYVINLVIPTSIITVVAVTGFFTPSSSSSERDEKLYLGINTLLTLLIMMLMICSSMPSTSNYVPLMGWYYMGIISAIVIGTFLATIVLLIHGQKSHMKPIPGWVRHLICNKFVGYFILKPPLALVDIWTEYGFISETRVPSEEVEEEIVQEINRNTATLAQPTNMFPSVSSKVSNTSKYSYDRKLASLTQQYDLRMRVRERRERQRRETIQSAADFLTAGVNNSRSIKKQKMMRRSALEWEFLANVMDRILLYIFYVIALYFFVLLTFFDRLFDITIPPPLS